jgi:hypothetical protein
MDRATFSTIVSQTHPVDLATTVFATVQFSADFLSP